MFVLATLSAASSNMRIILFMLVLVAVALILIGGVIAMVTLYTMRKTPTLRADGTRERERIV